MRKYLFRAITLHQDLPSLDQLLSKPSLSMSLSIGKIVIHPHHARSTKSNAFTFPWLATARAWYFPQSINLISTFILGRDKAWKFDRFDDSLIRPVSYRRDITVLPYCHIPWWKYWYIVNIAAMLPIVTPHKLLPCSRHDLYSNWGVSILFLFNRNECDTGRACMYGTAIEGWRALRAI